MLFKPEHNDIVLNFLLYKAYRFDSKNDLHRKQSGFCRHASFEEREKFIKLKESEISLDRILDKNNRNRRQYRWDKKEPPEITFQPSERQLAMFIKYANKYGVFDYGSIISKLFELADINNNETRDNELQSLKSKDTKRTQTIKAVINQLKNIEL
jgi:hypothetical protein